MIAANGELQERQLLKRAHLAAAMTDALRARGTDETAARLAAEVGVLAFSTAYARWAAQENREPFGEIALLGPARPARQRDRPGRGRRRPGLIRGNRNRAVLAR